MPLHLGVLKIEPQSWGYLPTRWIVTSECPVEFATCHPKTTNSVKNWMSSWFESRKFTNWSILNACCRRETGATSLAIAKCTLSNSSLLFVLLTRAWESATEESQWERQSFENSPPHNNWPAEICCIAMMKRENGLMFPCRMDITFSCGLFTFCRCG